MIRKRLNGLLVLYAALLCAFLFSQVYLPTLAEPKNILNSTFLMVLFTSSWFFVHIGVQNNPKRFVVNFMIMTVMQFLAFLTFELVLVLRHAPWIQVVHALGLCIVLLIIQSISLVQSTKS
jgi:hypothetical protein|tara:strand:- start:242 stop:604 length:363 start_codon:yes stop_codon:yes gene_type:complete